MLKNPQNWWNKLILTKKTFISSELLKKFQWNLQEKCTPSIEKTYLENPHGERGSNPQTPTPSHPIPHHLPAILRLKHLCFRRIAKKPFLFEHSVLWQSKVSNLTDINDCFSKCLTNFTAFSIKTLLPRNL